MENFFKATVFAMILALMFVGFMQQREINNLQGTVGELLKIADIHTKTLKVIVEK